MNVLEAVVLGAIEGVTEFLPISSTGHLTVAEELLGFDIDADDITAFTAIIQVGAIAAVVIYFWNDIRGILTGLARGIGNREARQTRDFRYGLAVAVGSIPIGIVGLALKDVIEGPLRNLWVVAAALILWSIPMRIADRSATEERGEEDFDMRDAIAMGLMQCIALVPGVSRSGATIVGGMLLGLDRRTAAEFSFFLAMPTMVAAFAHDLLEVRHYLEPARAGEIAVGFVTAFLAALLVVKPFLKFVSRSGFGPFAWYRIAVGVAILAAVARGWL
jgi:undecaprenyl-diphosphatase